MKDLMKTLTHSQSGYGHSTILIIKDGSIVKGVTNNMPAVDAAFNDDYDLHAATPTRIYSSQDEAKQALVVEILNQNDMEA